MAFIKYSGVDHYTGLSTDTKPTTDVLVGSTATEEDTGHKFQFGPSGWAPFRDISDNFGIGIPPTYTKQTASGRNFLIQKGQLNKYRLRPAILNEHVESSRTVQGIVSSSNVVGQVFRASQDNINGILLTLETAAGISLDDFESYADSAALQASWVEITNLALLETTIVKSGTQSMNIPLDATGDEWVKTITATDFTDFTGTFDFQQDRFFGVGGVEVSVFIGDGVNTKSLPLTVSDSDSWFRFEVNENAMAEDGGGTTDTANITQIGYRVDRAFPGANAYVDNLSAAPPPGSVGLKLWDMGTSIPESGASSIDDGTQYTELGDRGLNGGGVVAEVNLPLLGGKRLYTVKDFVAGVALEIPSNTILTPGNFYILTVNYVDTDVNVYGPDPLFLTNYYTNGFSFTAPDEATAITAVGEFNDCMFGIYSTQDAFLNTIVKFYDASPGGGASENIFIEDKNMSITDVSVGESTPLQAIQAEFNDRMFRIPKGGKFEVYHNDDFSDSTTIISLLMGYIYEPPDVNG